MGMYMICVRMKEAWLLLFPWEVFPYRVAVKGSWKNRGDFVIKKKTLTLEELHLILYVKPRLMKPGLPCQPPCFWLETPALSFCHAAWTNLSLRFPLYPPPQNRPWDTERWLWIFVSLHLQSEIIWEESLTDQYEQEGWLQEAKPVYPYHLNHKFHTDEIPKGIAGIWHFLPGQGLQEPACYSPALWLEEWSSPSWPWPVPCLDFSMGKGLEDAALPHCDEVLQSSTPEGNSNSMILTKKRNIN